MSSYQQVADRWVAICTGKSSRNHLKNQRMPIINGRIHSYGDHFEIARWIETEDVPGGGFFLLNGNRFSTTTDRHQWIVRETIRTSGKRFLIVPYDALDGARVVRDSIRPIESADETFARIKIPVQPDDKGLSLGPKPITQAKDDWHARRDWRWIMLDPYEKIAGLLNEAEWRREIVYREPDGELYRVISRHVLGEALFTARYRRQVHTPVEASEMEQEWRERVFERIDTHRANLAYYEEEVKRLEEILGERPYLADRVERYRQGVKTNQEEAERLLQMVAGHAPSAAEMATWFNGMHVDGERVYRVTGTTSPGKFLSGFDVQENPALYFLCLLPKSSKAKTIEDARLDLAPRIVHAAYAQERDVTRQGDIFAVAVPEVTTASLRKRGATFQKRVMTRDYEERLEVTYPERWSHTPTGRYGPASTWEIDRLEHTDYLTCGKYADSFMSSIATRQIYPAGYADSALYRAVAAGDFRFIQVPVNSRLVSAASLLGTAHTATEVATLPDGTVYARGCMYHEPSLEPGRDGQRDHRRQKIADGKTWALIVRNTVPRDLPIVRRRKPAAA